MKLLSNKQKTMLYDLVAQDTLTRAEIARKVKCSTGTVDLYKRKAKHNQAISDKHPEVPYEDDSPLGKVDNRIQNLRFNDDFLKALRRIVREEMMAALTGTWENVENE